MGLTGVNAPRVWSCGSSMWENHAQVCKMEGEVERTRAQRKMCYAEAERGLVRKEQDRAPTGTAEQGGARD